MTYVNISKYRNIFFQNYKMQNLQFLEWSLEAGSKFPIVAHVKMPNFRAEVNMFTACYRNGFEGLHVFDMKSHDHLLQLNYKSACTLAIPASSIQKISSL